MVYFFFYGKTAVLVFIVISRPWPSTTVPKSYRSRKQVRSQGRLPRSLLSLLVYLSVYVNTSGHYWVVRCGVGDHQDPGTPCMSKSRIFYLTVRTGSLPQRRSFVFGGYHKPRLGINLDLQRKGVSALTLRVFFLPVYFWLPSFLVESDTDTFVTHLCWKVGSR